MRRFALGAQVKFICAHNKSPRTRAQFARHHQCARLKCSMAKRYLVLLFIVATAAGAQSISVGECDALRTTFEKWTAAYAKRDLPGTMAIFADDVNFSFQGSPDLKKADLEKSYRDEF